MFTVELFYVPMLSSYRVESVYWYIQGRRVAQVRQSKVIQESVRFCSVHAVLQMIAESCGDIVRFIVS